MSRVLGIDHVQLAVPVGALPQARGFYEGLLGLPEVRHPALDKPGSLRFALGEQRLDLSEGTLSRSPAQAHLALRLRGVEALAESLKAQGVPVDGPSELPSLDGTAPALRLYAEDPFGNRLELIEAPAQEPADGADSDRRR